MFQTRTLFILITGIVLVGQTVAIEAGEQFEIQDDTVSHGVASGKPDEVVQIISPQPVKEIQPIIDAENITLEWPRPDGMIDFYQVTWYPVDNEDDINLKQIGGDVETEGINRVVKVLIENLRPGVSYNFEIKTISHNLKSQTIKTMIRTQPLCTSEMFIINNQEVTDSLIIRYTPTPLDRSTFDKYRFIVSEPGVPIKEKPATDPDRKVVFHNLIPGRMYNITLWTVSGSVTSRPVVRQDRLHPEPVANINAMRITDNEITLVWDRPEGDFDSFEVSYLDAKRDLIQDLTYTNSITIGRLRPHRNYTFTIVTKSGSDQNIPKWSTTIAAIFTTKESVPDSLTM